MRPTRLKRQASRMLRRHGDEMQPEERAAVERALNDPALLQQWADKINEACPDAPEDTEIRLYGANGEFLDKLWDWFKANWPTILKLLLSLVVLL